MGAVIFLNAVDGSPPVQLLPVGETSNANEQEFWEAVETSALISVFIVQKQRRFLKYPKG
jgi:hypothetical protein